MTLQAIFTPGHSPGSMSLLCPEEGVVIAADANQPVGGLPLYHDSEATRASIRRLMELPGVKTLYCAHCLEPYTGDEIQAHLQAGLDYLDRIDRAVDESVSELPAGATPEEITRAALLHLGFNPPPVMPVTIQSIMSHLARTI
jgi:glyoxylase-like metal-dependent hydrolase (beta-lactamase superfamily II)